MSWSHYLCVGFRLLARPSFARIFSHIPKIEIWCACKRIYEIRWLSTKIQKRTQFNFCKHKLILEIWSMHTQHTHTPNSYNWSKLLAHSAHIMYAVLCHCDPLNMLCQLLKIVYVSSYWNTALSCETHWLYIIERINRNKYTYCIDIRNAYEWYLFLFF